jgi:hypothetical protein
MPEIPKCKEVEDMRRLAELSQPKAHTPQYISTKAATANRNVYQPKPHPRQCSKSQIQNTKPETRNYQKLKKLKKLKICAGGWSYPSLQHTRHNISQPKQRGPDTQGHTPDQAPDNARNPKPEIRS